ncbi:MAG: PLP-dependent aminotransferase family protein, partial [Candidatus Nanopelagicales bacterium]|nr:PLP-dependent aminotransferase family protein [Candidatus Nanopelagicales bacterium]
MSQGSRLDPWVDSYASRAHAMRASEIRALFAVASRPEVVSLAGGMPFVQALPVDMLTATAVRVLTERGPTALQYGSGQGDVTLREQILEVIGEVGVTAHPDDIVVTPGSQMALDLVTRVFCDPGDVVLVEAPSYVGALGVFRAYECDVIHVAMDDEGLVPTALAEAIVAARSAGKRVKMIYTIPSFHNPAGVTQGPARRAEILAIAQREGIALLEDDPYGLLGFEGEPPRAIRADDAEGVIYLGSFSKTIASGLRVGWAVAPHGVREKLVLAAESAVLCPSNYAQLTVSDYLATQPWREQIKV